MSKCRKCRHQNEVEICEGCYDNDAYEGYTNADRIRAMSDEELAQLFTQYSCEDADYTSLLPIEECKWGTKQ